MARRERRHRQTYPGPNPEDNQQMLQDIKHSIETHSGGEKAGRSSAGSEAEMRTEKSLDRERPESRDREQSRERRSPPAASASDREQASPGTTPRAQQNRSTPTKQLTQLNSDRNKQQLREIRRMLRPFVRSDPGLNAAKDHVNKTMLEQLISLGYSENSAVGALLAVGNSSIDAALEHLQKKRLAAIHEDDSRKPSSPSELAQSRAQRRKSPEKSTTPGPGPSAISSSGLPTSQQRTSEPSAPYDITSRISPIQLPGFKTPVSFEVTDLPPALSDHQLMQQMSSTIIRHPQPVHFDPSTGKAMSASAMMTQRQMDDREGHSDSSPTRTSPPYIHSSPPPYFAQNGGSVEDTTHIHVSPPPEVHPQSYSPFSAPFSSRREPTVVTPQYDRSPYNQHHHNPNSSSSKHYATATRVTPSNEFSDSGIEEETTPRRTPVPPEAFKFFMEQHVENIFKSYHQRMQRRMKLEQEMAKRGLDEPTSEQMRRILYQKESNFLRLKRAKMHKDMFKTVKPLGIGAFGVVSLVRKVDTNKLYAMKTLRKADVLRRNQVAHVKAERDILAEADNEWVVKLFFSFQDVENLYFVMEYIPGGDMMSLLIKLGTFPEHLTLFYIAELVCAIESVHKMGFIHRDIKPDNILIGSDGHIKLTDFGLCTGFRWTHDSKRYLPKGHHQRHHSMEPGQWADEEEDVVKPLELRRVREHDRSIAHSLVGTPNYIAPEILRRVGYKQLCDWWSVGVIMYEMIVGQPPFMAPTPSETQHKIMNWSQYLRIPRHAVMSRSAMDLILRFCSDPMDRLGKGGIEEIKSHPFFSAIDWSVGIRNYEPPYIPKIMYDADTSNFDPIPQSQLQKLQSKKQHEVSSLPKGQPEHAFYEWTFIRFYPERGLGQKRPTITPSSVYTGSPTSSSPTASGSRHAANYSPPPPPPPSSGYERERRERPHPPTSVTATNTSSPSPIPSRERRKPAPQPVYV